LDAAALLAVLIEDPAQRRNLDGQITFLDRRCGPDGVHDRAFLEGAEAPVKRATGCAP
jgi:hypothetical protein